MNPLKKLAGQTAWYGIPTILGRLLNYLLVPLFTRVFEQGEYGVVSQFYAYSGFLLVIFTYGMETAFFRYFEGRKKNPVVFSTAMRSLGISTLILAGVIIAFSDQVAQLIRQPEYGQFVIFFALIIGMDALAALPFAKLRAEGKAKKFAFIRSVNILVNIGVNLFFLLLCPYILGNENLFFLHSLIELIYNPAFGIGYIFLANLLASAVTLLLLMPQVLQLRYGYEKGLWKEMLIYASPLIFVGLAGIVNETIDRILLKFLLPYSDDTNDAMIGIYSAAYKLSVLMTLFIQAFRYAAEPFFFAEAQKQNPKPIYALVLKYFVMAGCLIFLGVMLYIDILKYFIGPRFHEGLFVVPILLLANLFLGIYYSLSIWYKLTDKTRLGAYVAIGGALVTIVINILLIPRIGYEGSAWATFACYASMALASYLMGQRYYPIKYDLKKILFFIVLAVGIYFLSAKLIMPHLSEHSVIKYFINTILLLVFITLFWIIEKPSAQLRKLNLTQE